MNGQAAQISTRISVQYDFGPESHSPPSMPTFCSSVLTMPSGCSMVRQTVATTNDGSTYGIRNTARTTARPRYRFWVATAAAMPNGTVAMVEITANETLIQMECGRPDWNASTKFCRPTNGASSHLRKVYWSRSISEM